jgi:methionine-rich copper-binding protein CopC
VRAISVRSDRVRGGNFPPRFRLPGLSTIARVLATFAYVTVAVLAMPAGNVLAHAEPARAEPPINGRVATAPSKLEVWFSEEVDTKEVRLSVKGPDGSTVDQGDTAVDLFDPERRHVTVTLKPNLGPGNYVVSWHTVSALDGDAADGYFSYFVEGGTPSASPVASPAASPAATPIPAPVAPTATVAPGPTATVTPAAAVEDDSNFDSRAFGLAVLAGVVVAIGIYLFWRLVRPKPGSGTPPQ